MSRRSARADSKYAAKVAAAAEAAKEAQRARRKANKKPPQRKYVPRVVAARVASLPVQAPQLVTQTGDKKNNTTRPEEMYLLCQSAQALMQGFPSLVGDTELQEKTRVLIRNLLSNAERLYNEMETISKSRGVETAAPQQIQLPLGISPSVLNPNIPLSAPPKAANGQ